jgi:hypothetical protein
MENNRINVTNNMVGFSNTKGETFFDRHAWKLLLVVCLFIGFFGVSDMVRGASDLKKGETILMDPKIHS